MSSEMSADFAIQTINLTKSFLSRGRVITAVDRASLAVARGEIFGLMGPNGAGKTTLLKILTTLLLPTSGEAYVAGHAIREEAKVKRSIGVVSSEERSFYWRLTGRENLRFFACLHNLASPEITERIQKISREMGIEDYIDRRFDSYSTGMKQKLSIARSLIGDPQILFVDEPTRGLDPIAASQMRGIFRDLSKRGITIFIITHSPEEADEICGRVAIMDKGGIKAEVKPWDIDLKEFIVETVGAGN
jgi:ABC-2 type transport system ATP-binding protein